MKCPVCSDADLAMTDRQGIEIDYCPKCRGVWLDRGELDKIIERTSAEAQPRPAAPSGGYDSRQTQDHGHYKKKKKSLLADLLDF